MTSVGFVIVLCCIIAWFLQLSCTLGQYLMAQQSRAVPGGTTVIVQTGAPTYQQLPGGVAMYHPPQPGTYVAGVPHPAGAGKLAYPPSTV